MGDTIALPPHPLHRSVLSQDSFQLRSSAPANSLSLHTHPHCLESLASRRGIPSPPQASPAAIFQSEDPSKLPPPAPLDLSGCQPPSAIPYSPPFLWKIAPAAGVLRINPASQALHPPPSSNTFEGRPYWDSQHAFSQQQVLSEFPPAAYSTKETPFHRSSFISLNHPLHSPLVNPQQQPLLNQQWGGPREGPRGGPREGLLESSRWVQSASNHAAPPGGGRLAAPAGARPIASTDPRLFRAGPEILGLAESKPLLIRPLDPNSSALENLGQNLALENLGQSFAPGALQRPPVMPPLRLLGPRNSPPFPPANPTANSPTNPQGLPWLAPRAAQSRRCALARPEPLLSGIGVNRPGQTSSVAQAPAQTLAPTTTLAPTLSPIPAPGSTSTPDLAPVSPAVSGGAEESSGGGSRPWPYQGAASQPAPSLSPDGAGTSESGSEEPDFSSDPSWLPPGLGKPAAVGKRWNATRGDCWAGLIWVSAALGTGKYDFWCKVLQKTGRIGLASRAYDFVLPCVAFGLYQLLRIVCPCVCFRQVSFDSTVMWEL